MTDNFFEEYTKLYLLSESHSLNALVLNFPRTCSPFPTNQGLP